MMNCAEMVTAFKRMLATVEAGGIEQLDAVAIVSAVLVLAAEISKVTDELTDAFEHGRIRVIVDKGPDHG